MVDPVVEVFNLQEVVAEDPLLVIQVVVALVAPAAVVK